MTATDDAAAIWQAALAAVAPSALVRRRLACGAGWLLADNRPLAPLAGRVAVVGGGKAAAGLAAGLGDILAGAVDQRRIGGLLSVPEGLTAPPARGSIVVRATRPAGVNLPTPAAVAATAEMLDLLARLGPDDLALALVTGGGSACLVGPRPGLSLGEKIAVTQFLAAAGADIRELNVVRQAASSVKGGGLARACTAGHLVALVLSDIIGDPLDLIGSGPCVAVPPRAAAALDVLERRGALAAGICPTLRHLLEEDLTRGATAAPAGGDTWTTPRGCRVEHVLLGSNTTALAAAALAARGLGYDVIERPGDPARCETATAVGRRLAVEGRDLIEAARRARRPRALIEGGEAVVRLPADHGRGGRNQQTAAAAWAEVWRTAADWPAGLVVASIGTDGEDGPTDAAGGCIDAAVAARLATANGDPEGAVSRCDAYPLLAATGGLVVTGPTGTNVADVRIVLAKP